MLFSQVSDDEEDEMCSDMNSLSQNDKSDSCSVPKRAVPSKSGINCSHLYPNLIALLINSIYLLIYIITF